VPPPPTANPEPTPRFDPVPGPHPTPSPQPVPTPHPAASPESGRSAEQGHSPEPGPRPDPARSPEPGASAESGASSQAAVDPNPHQDPVLRAEREHLVRSRQHLARMRERAGAVGDVGVDAFASEALGVARIRRLRALADDPAVPPFFGRVDRVADSEHPRGETFHIGRRHIRDDVGDPLVIDWRAPMSRSFYRATATDPMGVRRRRRFGFAGGTLTSYEDETLEAGAAPAGESRILLEEIERPRVGPMRDIVATIQPDQDDLVRADLDDSVCIQGAPGTGKTAVGLHRAAYLLYTYPERLRRSGVLVVGPNRAFLGYIAQVLPALGEIGVTQATLEELLAPVPVRATDPPEVATLKGDGRMAEVLRRAVTRQVRRPTDSVVVVVGTRRCRIPPERLRRYVDDLRRSDVHHEVARERLQVLLAEDVRRQREAAGGAPSDADTVRVARSAAVRDFVNEVWPAVDPATLVHDLLTRPELLAAVARGLLEPAEQKLLLWERVPRSARTVRWSAADAVLVDEVAGLLHRPESYGHVVLDEAQDLSPMQCRGVARRCPTGSMTVLGDIAQGTTPWSTSDWRITLNHLGQPNARIEPLTRGYRVPAEVLDLANRLLPHLANGLTPATSVRRAAESLRTRSLDPAASLPTSLAGEARRALAGEGSIGVIVADADVDAARQALDLGGVRYAVVGADSEPESIEEEPDAGRDGGAEGDGAPQQQLGPRVSLVPVTLANGLEFDQVVLGEPAAIVAAEPRGLRRLYVALTRAVSRLVLVHQHPLPAELAA
jgi:DNA helicase IV